MDKYKKGYIHLYTGDGKGKTTAAIGLAVRAACSGKKVYIGQFIKGMEYNEIKMSDYIPNIEFELFGEDCFIEKKPTEADIKMGRDGLKRVGEVLKDNKYDMVILDEITIGLYYKMYTVEEVIEIIENRNPKIEVIITGRYAPDKLIESADLVTEMKEIKHYYNTIGLKARDGIER